METKILFEKVTKSDARKLVEYWNANTDYYHFVRKRDNDKFYNVIRQL